MHLRNPAVFRRVTLAAAVMMVSSCVSVPLAPGADKVKFTNNAADVTGCKAVGNVSAEYNLWQPEFSRDQLRNKTVGLDGNTVFLTSLAAGVAYRCQQSG